MTRARNSANLASHGNLFVDITNDRTGIGSVVPAQNLHVAGTAGFHADTTFTGDLYNTTWDRSDNSLKFVDNAKAKFGTSDDLQIYHDGGHSRIVENGTGNLVIQSDGFRLRSSDQSEVLMMASKDNSVDLYFNNVKKFETTAYGTNTTGTAVNDGLVVAGVATVTTMNVTGVLTYDDVTSVDSVGIVTARQGVSITGGNLTISTASPQISLTETNGDPDYRIFVNGGIFNIEDVTNNIGKFSITSSRITLNDTVLVNDSILYIHDKIVHWADDNTTIRFPTNDTISFETAGSERVRITSTGRFGIGTQSPSKTLHVHGDSGSELPVYWIRAGSSVGGYLYSDGGGSGIVGGDGVLANTGIYLVTDTRIDFRVNGSERLRITSSGDLSLRSTTQNAYLGLTANSNAINLTLGSTSGTSPRLYLKGTGNGQSDAGDVFLGAGTGGIVQIRSAGLIKFEVNSDSSISEALRIATDGDLTHTGADNVEYKMKCGSSSGNNIIAFQNSGGTTRGNITYDSDNNFLFFNVNQSERVRINSNGQLLVGATTNSSGGIAEFSKDVGGGAQGCHLLVKNTSTNSVNNTARLKLETSGGTAEFFAFAAAETYLRSRTGGAANLLLLADGASKIRMFTNGNERVNITSTGTVLHGSGAIATQKASNGGFDISCNTHSLVIGADSNSGNLSQARTNNAIKDGRIGHVHYTNAEEPIGIVRVHASSSENVVYFGGGSSIFNAATSLQFYTAGTNTTTSGTERVRITSSGDFGIGTNSPDRKLDVSGTGNVYGKFQSTNTTGAGIEVKDISERWLIQADGGSVDGLAFYDLGRTAYRFVMGDAGQLGVGGANYGSSGQVLTSGGASGAASWTTISGTTINSNADNRVITGSGTANTLNAESGLLWSGTTLTASGSTNQKIILQGATHPYIHFYEGTTGKAFIQWHADGYMRIKNDEDDATIRLKDNIEFSPNDSTYYKMWHAGNDGSGSGLDADTLDGVDGANYVRTNQNTTITSDLFIGGGAGGVTVNAGSDIRFTNGNWTGNVNGTAKIQHHSNYLYISGGTSGIIFRENNDNRWLIDGSGHFRPGLTNTYDIGSSSFRVRNLYTQDLQLSNEAQKDEGGNDVDGTWGDWTLQEGESDVYMINNRSGKKFRIKMEEV